MDNELYDGVAFNASSQNFRLLSEATELITMPSSTKLELVIYGQSQNISYLINDCELHKFTFIETFIRVQTLDSVSASYPASN